MHAPVEPSPRPSLVALALTAALALAPACGDSGTTTTTEEGTTAGETTGATDAATTDTPTTDPGTTGGSTGSSTTGAPGVCDGSMASNAFECEACKECGSWTTPLPGSEYPAAIVCLLEGMRDDAVVGAETQSCEMGKCLVDRLLTTGMGTLISQQMILDQNDQSMKYLSIQELPFKDPSYFETCLGAFDATCATPNSWFNGASVDIVDLVCP